MSGPATSARANAGAVALPLPVRVLDAPFSRALRARTSGVLDALLSGRGWIALIGVLLVGIVFFNVDLLRMNREIAQTAERGEVLKRENARLRQQAALLGSSERIQEAAAGLGMVLPAAGDVRFLKAYPDTDARKAARRITEPNEVAVTTTTPVAPVVPETSAVETPETAAVPEYPAAATTATPDPTATAAPTQEAVPTTDSPTY
jgi:cell division protein FtsL